MAERQRIIHITTELIALLIGLFLIYVGISKEITWQRPFLILIGIGNLLLDGWLLTTWRK